MTPEQFCYWLQGFGELTPEPPSPEQWTAIKQHLGTVFQKATPPAPGEFRALGPVDPLKDWQGRSIPNVPVGPLVARC